MTPHNSHFYSLHELLVMASLAALGGVTSAALSIVRAAVHAVVVLPGGMQYLAGLHVVWLVIAAGLIRKPGAATITGLLKGTVELLSGNPHGLLVVAYSGVAGVAVDVVWILLGNRDRLVNCMLAGGVGSASNVLMLGVFASLPAQESVLAMLGVLGGVSLVSGAVLGGMLGWWLLRTLRLAGIVAGPAPARARDRGLGAWGRAGVLGMMIALLGAATYLAAVHTGLASTDDAGSAPSIPDKTATPR